MALDKARVSMPAEAKRGEIIEIKTLVRHAMETGYRVDRVGALIPRDIIKRLTVAYRGVEIFGMDYTQGVAANPYLAFSTVATETGELVFTWEDQHGAEITVRKTLVVSE